MKCIARSFILNQDRRNLAVNRNIKQTLLYNKTWVPTQMMKQRLQPQSLKENPWKKQAKRKSQQVPAQQITPTMLQMNKIELSCSISELFPNMPRLIHCLKMDPRQI